MPPSPENDPGRVIVRQLLGRGVRDRRVLEAIRRVPRPLFVPPATRGQALDDRAVPIGCDQTISQPFIVAVMTVELALRGVERVLEVGTGSGYQTAILARLAREVWTVERHAELSLRARGVLDGLGFENIRYRIGDGTLGWPEAAPFDRVLITAAAPKLPGPVFDGLAEGGLLVLPLGDEEAQRLTSVRKVEGRAVFHEGLPCRFVPLIGEEGWGEPTG